MTCLDLARRLTGLRSEDEVYRELLLFLARYTDGYGVACDDGDRGSARQVAHDRGYFWLPCLVCGRWRGGQETGGPGVLITRSQSVGTCNDPACVAEARRIRTLYPNGLDGRAAPGAGG